MQSKLHKKYYYILIVVAIVPMLIVNLTTYNLLRSNIVKEIEQRELSSLWHTVEEVEFELQNAETVSAQAISNFLNYYTSYQDIISMPYDNFKNMLNYNKTLILYNDYIKSIYLYEEGAEHILVNEQFYSFKNFHDTSWLEYYEQNIPAKNAPLWIYSRQYSNGDFAAGKYASYIRPFSSVEYNRNGYVVINIDLHKLYEQIMGSNNGNQFVYNDIGQIIYKNDNLYDSIKLEDTLNKEIKIDGETHITFHHIAPINKFHYISAVSKNELFSSLAPLKIINIILVFIASIILIVSCIYFSKKMYTPIIDISNLVSSLNENGQSEGEIDFDSIKEYIQDTASKVNALELKISNDSNIVNEHKLQKLLRGEIHNYTSDDIENVFKCDAKEFLVVAIENYAFNQSNNVGYHEILLEKVHEHYDMFNYQCTKLDSDLMVIIIYSDITGFLSQNMYKIKTYCCEIIKQMELNGFKYMSAGIGDITCDVEGIGNSLSLALLASKNRLYLPERTSAYSDIKYGSDDICFSFASDYLQQLVQYVKERKLEKCQALIGEMCKAIKEVQCTPDTVCSILGFMRDRLLNIPKSMGYSNDEIFFHNQQDIYELFHHNTHIEEYEQYFVELCRSIISGLNVKSSQKYRELSDNIKQYLIEHISEDISLNKVADIYGISTSYLSTIFKRETGQNYVKFVTCLKMETAMKLIAKNDSTTFAEVSEQVGYYNIRSFYNTFKKYTGLTPSEYKKKILKQKV